MPAAVPILPCHRVRGSTFLTLSPCQQQYLSYPVTVSAAVPILPRVPCQRQYLSNSVTVSEAVPFLPCHRASGPVGGHHSLYGFEMTSHCVHEPPPHRLICMYRTEIIYPFKPSRAGGIRTPRPVFFFRYIRNGGDVLIYFSTHLVKTSDPGSSRSSYQVMSSDLIS